MKKETIHIPYFVSANIQNTATEEEKLLLAEWLKIPGNAILYNQLRKIDTLSSDVKLYRSFDPVSARKKVERVIRETRKTKVLSRFQRVAAVLVFPLALFSLLVIYQNRILKNDLNSAAVLQQIDTQPGVKSHFFLPDSTEVWLNAASSIEFPVVFTGNTRLVKLDGEAYFKVYKDKSKPFVVRNGTFEVEALGTAFNLCAYSGDKRFMATLEEGKIKVSQTAINQSLLVVPGEQVSFLNDNQQFSKSTVVVDDFIAWKDGRLVFNKTPFFEVVLTLNRWYNADIQLVDESIAGYRYTATFTNESLSQILELLKLTAPIDYTVESRMIKSNNSFTKEEIKIFKKGKRPM